MLRNTVLRPLSPGINKNSKRDLNITLSGRILFVFQNVIFGKKFQSSERNYLAQTRSPLGNMATLHTLEI
jgi:hypothetical protein